MDNVSIVLLNDKLHFPTESKKGLPHNTSEMRTLTYDTWYTMIGSVINKVLTMSFYGAGVLAELRKRYAT